MEAILTIAPPPFAFICGKTAWMPLNTPPRLTSMTRFHSAAVIVPRVFWVIVPAELTSTSIPPDAAAMSSASCAHAGPSETSS